MFFATLDRWERSVLGALERVGASIHHAEIYIHAYIWVFYA
jgi:hypothetical protein